MKETHSLKLWAYNHAIAASFVRIIGNFLNSTIPCSFYKINKKTVAFLYINFNRKFVLRLILSNDNGTLQVKSFLATCFQPKNITLEA